MIQQIKKWTFRLVISGFFMLAILFFIILNPMFTYAHKTTHQNFIIFSQEHFDVDLIVRLEDASALLSASEFYNPAIRFDICLNDGGGYPALIRMLRGRAFAWGFYDKVVLQGALNSRENFVELNDYKWNLTQLLAHEMTHCLQFKKLGFWKSNPVAKIADWKWEGYAEYVSRQHADQQDLAKNINRLHAAEKDSWAINFEDGTIAPRTYYNYWMLLQYCMDVKKMSYEDILADARSEQDLTREMLDWWRNHIPKK